LKFLFIEPFFGGSHREFAEGLIEHTHHRMDLLTLPARFWKWRMRGAALHFIKKCRNALSGYDGLVTSGLMSLADFKALVPDRCPPSLLYFHESQLTYPLAPGEEMDYQFGFTDITSALAASRILFNSETHRTAFFEALPGFLKMMPDHRPNWVMDAVKAKSGVLYPGCRFPAAGCTELRQQKTAAPLIIWNHRWEFDKEPETFFEVLDVVLKSGCEFRLALLGESARAVPKPFISAKQRLGRRVVQYGYVESREDYVGWLEKGDITISTAIQENFGVATVEAIRCGCLPLLPQRLSYPEIIPRACHAEVLYRDREDLVAKLVQCLTHLPRYRDLRRSLSKAMGRYSWQHQIDLFDRELEKLALMDLTPLSK
jgi:glycosyltransferase involved in cell wall biosynthesis